MLQYLTDNNGCPQAVVVPMIEWERILSCMRALDHATIDANSVCASQPWWQEKERFQKITAALDWAKNHIPNDQTTAEILERLANA